MIASWCRLCLSYFDDGDVDDDDDDADDDSYTFLVSFTVCRAWSEEYKVRFNLKICTQLDPITRVDGYCTVYLLFITVLSVRISTIPVPYRPSLRTDKWYLLWHDPFKRPWLMCRLNFRLVCKNDTMLSYVKYTLIVGTLLLTLHSRSWVGTVFI